MARQGFWFQQADSFTMQLPGHIHSGRLLDDQPPAGSTVARIIGRMTIQVALDTELQEPLYWPVGVGVQVSPTLLTPAQGSSPGYLGQEWPWWAYMHATATDVISGQTEPRISAGTVSELIDLDGQRVLADPSYLRWVAVCESPAMGSPGYMRLMTYWRTLVLYP